MDYAVLVHELQELSLGLMKGTTLLVQQSGHVLECRFLKNGLTSYQVRVSDNLLAAALRAVSVRGIIEGLTYLSFRHNFSKFELHVKAKKLYFDLITERGNHKLKSQELLVA